MSRMIILAAGQGTRLRPLTNERPKCMVELHGKPLVHWQMTAANAAGIDEIVIVRGFAAAALEAPGARFVDNPEFESTNMVYSLWCAREFFGDDFTLAYGDIVYRPELVETLRHSRTEIGVVVDRKWRSYWEQRFENPLSDAETLKLASDGRITEIGQKPSSLGAIEAQYIGLTQWSGEGVRRLREVLEREVAAFRQGRGVLHPTRTLGQLYITDLLQALIDAGTNVRAVPIDGGWLEIDSLSDLELATRSTRAHEQGLEILR